MNEMTLKGNDEIVIKLLHYFITEYDYNPVVLHGAKDEIWLENMDSDYKIIRISTNYIHNDEQLDYDLFRTKQILKNIKKKTFSYNADALNIFLNLGDNVHEDKLETPVEHINSIKITKISDLEKHPNVMEVFPTITKKTNFKEKGGALFMKLTEEINKKNIIDSKKAEDVFKPKKAYVTYGLITLNILIFFMMYLFGNGSYDSNTLLDFGASYGPFIKNGEYYRLLSSAFLHIGLLHLTFNMYALYIIGKQLEGFYGPVKYLIIYLFSAITGNLLSILFSTNVIGAGASGAIFGLLGSLLYFGYHYRVYLGSTIRSQILPLIFLNLFLGYISTGVDNVAHIGGLIGGLLISIALGVKYKTNMEEQTHGIVMTTIFLGFLIFLNFFA
ncbi:MAG: rhomboid family intramembrane serine protease [Bacilli bacterium]|nr:rhomboid family intramembrane serine protease [Bacilli bacterium]